MRGFRQTVILLAVRASAVGAVLFSATAAMGQKPGRVPDDDGGILQWGVALGIVVLCAAAAFINPKRSHLD